ncbi:MAG: TonB-dependent receptor [Candidatus Marinimicrobia bacterium]|nr:TonB-dependent receptor [Candidatus Neomarinimicrobiota bacterium]
MNRLTSLLLVLMTPFFLFAQGSVSGSVSDANTGDALAGANVVVEGTTMGAAADANGSFTINDVSAGTYTVTASMIGYASQSQNVNVSGSVTVNFNLETSALELSALEVLASRAGENTPVAYTNISKADMEVRLGSQDIPMILNTTPSVYATQQGGGAGDARINVRGFNQRNVAVMINGVPQNDMENGWVYWSNWDGVGDATSSIQMQRGLSAVNLATPSIGGTMNIITDPTALKAGGKFKQEFGAGGFLKSTLNYNTGLIADKFAVSSTIVRKTGDGIIDQTWTDAWAYYFGASFAMNETNRFELYAIGAPQRHGQNLYKQNIANYDQDFAKDVDGFDTDAFADGAQFEHEAGRFFNQNAAPVSSSYKGKQYWYMYGERETDRYDPDYLSERENYFHKPLINLNHYLTINDQMRLSSILYWSGGSGGGTGTYGSVKRLPAIDGNAWYSSSPWVWDWDAEIAENSDNVDSTWSDNENRSTGILRNSINRQSTIGAISKLNYDMNDALKLQFGVDWRTAGIEHAREVRDLLGGDYYVDYIDDNNGEDADGNNLGKMRKLGDIIAYHNETTVDWIGFFGQGNFVSGPLSVYGMAGWSSIKYTYQDHFTVADKVIEADAISTMQFKGGALYNLSESLSFFANGGLVEKAPIMDNVIDVDGYVATDPANEQFISFEGGANYRLGNYAVKVNAYSTDWIDRNLTKSVTTGQGSSGDTDIIYLTGVNQKHTGLEIELSAQLMDMLRLDAAISLGTWKFEGDAEGKYTAYTDSGTVQTDYAYALDGLFVGDMPQTSYVLGATVTPITGFRAQLLFNMYDDNYSDWSPDAREYDSTDPTDTPDTEQVWSAPGYSKMDLHLYYDLPIQLGSIKLQAFAHVFNLLDAVYVQDAVDNSQYNGWGGTSHDADNAEVFLGTPRYFNAGVSVRF